MVGVARSKTNLEKAGEAARAALSKAKEAHDKTPNATTKAALDSAKLKANEATKAENRERFETIGTSRAIGIVTKMKAMSKAFNKRSYEFTESDIGKLEKLLTDELNTLIETARNNLKSGPKAAPVVSGFKF
jgi:hypothetical protein